MPNTFSSTWFSVFLDTIPAESTEAEVAFVSRHIPLPEFTRVVDVCCGPGRHAIPLAHLGYQLLGIDADANAFARASSCGLANARFLQMDARRLGEIPEEFDAALCLWQSFGFFDDDENLALLRSIRARLRPGGRFIIDLYNLEHFAALPLTELGERGGRTIHTTRRWAGNRYTATVRYDDGPEGDESEWTLYSPEEFVALAETAGFSVRASCAWFDESIPASAEHARMQFVLERA